MDYGLKQGCISDSYIVLPRQSVIWIRPSVYDKTATYWPILYKYKRIVLQRWLNTIILHSLVDFVHICVVLTIIIPLIESRVLWKATSKLWAVTCHIATSNLQPMRSDTHQISVLATLHTNYQHSTRTIDISWELY